MLQLKHTEEYNLEDVYYSIPGIRYKPKRYVDIDIIDRFIPTIPLPKFGVVTQVLETTVQVEFDVTFDVVFKYESYDKDLGIIVEKTGKTEVTETIKLDIPIKEEFDFNIDDIIKLEDFFDQDALLKKVKAKLEAQLDSYIYFSHGNGEFNELVPEEFGLEYEFTVVDDAGGAISLPAILCKCSKWCC